MNGNDELVIKNLQYIETIFNKVFGSRLSEIANIDAKRITISNNLNDINKFLIKDPNLHLITLIQNTYAESKGNVLLFLRNLRAKEPWIKMFQSELSEYILTQLGRTEKEFGSTENFRILIDLYATLVANPNKEYIIGFLKTPLHPTELRNATSKIRNSKISKQIRETIEALTNEEVNYLIKYHAEVSSWNNKEALTEDIDFFTRKTNSFLYGRSEQYLGLFSYFKDEELDKKLSSNPPYLQLVKYNLQLLYLKRLRNKIETYKTGNWYQFEEVYKNVKRIANIFIKEFGNKDIASELFQEKAKVREYPQRWLYDIDKKIAEISSTQYRKINVIAPFIKELERIFNERINELRVMAKPEIAQLKEALKPLIKLEINIADKITKELANYRKNIRKNIEKIKKDFDTISNSCIDTLHDFVEAKFRLIDQEIKNEVLARLKKANTMAKNEVEFTQHSLQTIGQDLEKTLTNPIVPIALLYDFEQAFRALFGATYNLRSISEIFTEKDVLKKVSNLNKNLEIAEKAYKELDTLITTKLAFLLEPQPNEQLRRDEYARAREAA